MCAGVRGGRTGVVEAIAGVRRRPPLGGGARLTHVTMRIPLRQRAATASKAWAILYSRWLGKDEAMATVTRRTPDADQGADLEQLEPYSAAGGGGELGLPARPMRRRAHIST